MRIAIISDIHSNYDALKKVLEDISVFQVDRIISLGDNIGYGPEPNETIALLMENKISSVLGNHEIAVLNQSNLKKFNKIARYSLVKTIKKIDKNSLNYIRNCTNYISRYGFHFVHGMPPDSTSAYMSRKKPDDIKQLFNKIFSKVCFTGHTHVLTMLALHNRKLDEITLNKGIFEIKRDRQYLINAGSVGQPRDGNKSAKYLIFDDSSYKMIVRYVNYDRQKVINKMLKEGYPEEHTIRLK